MRARWEEIEVGGEIPRLDKAPIDRVQLVRYSAASGDMNRIHIDEPFAREAGFPGVIAHGMLSMGFVGELLVRWAGPTAVARLGVRFKAVTFPGDAISCRGEVTGKREEGGRRLLDLRVWCEKPDGTVTVEGTATVVLTADPLPTASPSARAPCGPW